jgi:hypothetical protein
MYALCVGISMAVVWGVYFATGSLFGVAPNPAGLGFHIAAELATGAALFISGIGILKERKWGSHVYFLGMGMLLYAVVNSPGLYPGNKIMMGVFAGSFVFAAVFIILGFMSDKKQQ